MPTETWPCRDDEPHQAHGRRLSWGEYRCPGVDPIPQNRPAGPPSAAPEPPAGSGPHLGTPEGGGSGSERLPDWEREYLEREARQTDAVPVTRATADVITEAVALVTGWQAGTAVDGRRLTAAVTAMQAGYGAMSESKSHPDLAAAIAATPLDSDTITQLPDGTVPEPVDGPGWDRGNVQSIIEAVELASRDPEGGPPHMALEDADELRALLADRDQGWALLAKVERKWLAQATRATDSEIRAAEVRAERDRLVSLEEELVAARTERADYLVIRDRHLATAQADTARLRARLDESVLIHPGTCAGEPVLGGSRIPAGIIAGLLADGADLEQIQAAYPGTTAGHLDAVRAWDRQRQQDRRDGAAGALDDAVRRIRAIFTGDTRGAEVADYVEGLATDIRARQVPASQGSTDDTNDGGDAS